jgi:glycosyltransferase involved in cell wall biosynthesis
MNSKHKLLIYSSAWHEQRNILFSHYLSAYFEVTIITSFVDSEKVLELVKPTKVVATKFWFKNKVGLSFSFLLKKFVKKYNPSFVMTLETHSISSFQSIKLSNIFNFKPIVFSWQNLDTIPKYFFQSFIQKKIILNSMYMIAGTYRTKKYLEKKGGESNKIFINPETGYDGRIFNSNNKNIRKSWGLEDDDFIVMFAGRLVEEKGIKVILGAAKKIEPVNNKIKFIFVGKGYLRNTIVNFNSKNVFYKGNYNYFDMGKVFNTCDIFVYPSISTKYWSEQFGYSVIEAQACGKVTIVSSSGSLPLFVREGVNGSIIEEKNEFELKSKILWWYNRLKNYKEIDINVINKFQAKNIALNYKKILLDKELSFLNNWFE